MDVFYINSISFTCLQFHLLFLTNGYVAFDVINTRWNSIQNIYKLEPPFTKPAPAKQILKETEKQVVLILNFHLKAQVRKHNQIFSIMPKVSFANKFKKKRTIIKDPIIAAACWRWTSMKNQINLEGTSLMKMQTDLVSFEIWQFLWRSGKFCMSEGWLSLQGMCMEDSQWKQPTGEISHHEKRSAHMGQRVPRIFFSTSKAL